MLSLTLKIILMFIVGILIMRVMGKSTIVQLTPYDLVAIIIIGTVIAEPLISTEIKPTLLALAVLVALYIIFSKLSLNQFFNKILLGRPTILIKHGKIIEENIEKQRISLIQLTSILRANGYPRLDEIEYAILEPTGEVSILPKSNVRSVTISDLDIKAEYEGLPIGVIIDGKVQKKNLQLIDKDEDWLKSELEKEGISKIKDVIYAYAIDKSDDIFFNLRR